MDPVIEDGTELALSQNKVGGTRLDKFLAKIAGNDVGELTPKTNTERMLAKIYGDPAMSDIAPKTATEMALDAVAMQYDKMLIPDGSLSITENGTYNVADKETAEVNVPNPSTGSLSITKNGTYDVTEKASAVVNVPSVSWRGKLTIINNSSKAASLFYMDAASAQRKNYIMQSNTSYEIPLPTFFDSEGETAAWGTFQISGAGFSTGATGTGTSVRAATSTNLLLVSVTVFGLEGSVTITDAT